MKRILLAILTLLLTAPVMAQIVGVKPSDVPPFVQQPRNLPDAGQNEIIGDGLNTNAWGGTPPWYASMPADIPTPNRESYLSSSGLSFCGGPPGDPNQCETSPGVYRAPQPKFRSTVNGCKLHLGDDPVLYARQPGKSHFPHQFYGNCTVNAGSTYATLRNTKLGVSVAGGTDLNRTGYWINPPCMKPGYFKFGDGRRYCVNVNYVTVYYACDNAACIAPTVFIPRGLRYVTGMRMTDPDDLVIKARIAAGNAKPGNAGRYSYLFNGALGFVCVNNGAAVPTLAGGSYAPALALADGSDPWGGNCKGKDAPGISSMEIIAEFNGQECWDGVQPWGGPTGQDHMNHKVFDNVAGKRICFNGQYHLPALELKVSYTFNTTGEWVNYNCSADAMAQASLVAQGSSRQIRPCESLHADWFGGWDDTTFREWQRNIGVMGGRMDGKIYELNDNTISPTQRMAGQPLTTKGTASPSVMFRLPITSGGAGTAHSGH